MLELCQVTKSYGGVVVIQPMSLALPVGQTLALIGPSGCGKSTLLRLLVGLIRPDSGEVRWQGQPLRPEQAPSFRQQLGFVVQDGGLFPHLTARGNAILMAKHLGWTIDRIQARLDDLANLTHFPAAAWDRYPAELSGGQRQRIALIRGLFLDPPLLFLDEPLGALDPLVRTELQAELRSIFQQVKKTVVLVTHDLAEAGYLGDELLLMRAGQIEQRATYQELLSHPATPFVRQFLTAQRVAA